VTIPRDSSLHLAVAHRDVGLGEEFLGALAIEALGGRPARDIERVHDTQPLRQHRHVGDEADVAHQRVALALRIAPQHLAARPRTAVRPRIALSAVVLPAPFGPIRPTIRPAEMSKSMPSSATVLP
jgi:hypothetical protein